MLSKPKHGWSKINIGEFKRYVSYLTDVPMDCLKLFIKGIESNKPISIYFDMEGSSFILTTDYYNTYIVLDEKEELETFRFEMNIFDLAKELINDISENIDDWVNWFDYEMVDKEYIGIRKQKIQQLLKDLQLNIEEKMY